MNLHVDFSSLAIGLVKASAFKGILALGSIRFMQPNGAPNLIVVVIMF